MSGDIAKQFDGFARLREPFPPEQIGKLPRLTCKDCSKKSCQTHKKTKCKDCNAYISTAHIHLDYVGHASVTDRLLEVDPSWTWEPVAFEEDGTPKISTDLNGNPAFWIKLTVLEVTRYGVGTCDSGAFEGLKQLVSDALRNAAMRFGVALDLWSKEDLAKDDPEPQYASPEQLAELRTKAEQAGKPMTDILQAWKVDTEESLTVGQVAASVQRLDELAKAEETQVDQPTLVEKGW